ncbi:hypothetical protein AB0M89_27030 [Streptomyces microflavus]|uniref:hypothetical protein n=1 Tax=Streptomyces microflavus TaxID=1919 RepID=UPI00342751C4
MDTRPVGDGTLSGISFTDPDLSPWAPVTSEHRRMPTIEDYSSPFDEAPEED